MRFRRLPIVSAIIASLALFAVDVPVAQAEAPMSFHAVRIGDPRSCGDGCPAVIAATGQITENTPNQFANFVQQSYGGGNLHAVVFIDSPGGRVLASMELGEEFRRLGAAAVVARVFPNGAGGSVMTNAQCFSACVYAFMGASKRVVPPRSQIGIHRMFMVEEGLDASGTALVRRRRFDNGDVRSELMRYSSSMGVNPAIITEAEHISSDSLHILSRSEIRRYHLGVPKL